VEPFNLRPLRTEDAAAAAALEQLVPDSWSEAAIADTLAAEHTYCFGAWQGAHLVGLCLCSAVLDEASLYAVTVAPAARRQGVATALLAHLFACLEADGIHALFLEVRSQNAPARTLYRTLGFDEIGLRRGFYSAPADDAVLMQKAL
jgi:ribosomal-protein-alanine N-acetyltransferase